MRTEGPGPVVVLGSVRYDGHRLYEQRLATALSTAGPVTYVDPPAVPRSAREVLRRERWVGPVLVSRTAAPPYVRRLRLSGLEERCSERGLARAAGRGVGAVVSALTSARALKRVRGVPRVVLVKDDYVAGASLIGGDPAVLLDRLDAAAEEAEAVVVVSPVLATTLAARGIPAQVIPAGCDPLPEGRPPAVPAGLRGRPGERAVFLGQVSDRMDLDLLTAVADAGVTVHLVGQVQRSFSEAGRLQSLVAGSRGRVVLLGQMSAADVVAHLVHSDVGLVPYRPTAFNLASFPLKVLEYLAAGLPVVSTSLPAVSSLGAPGVVTADGPAAFAAATARTARQVTEELRAANRGYASQHSWDVRGRSWLELLLRLGAEMPVASRA